ncbi:uncharacterized protein LOC122259473 isoform X2 [Penaeus japonicus]|uniref:uncharacterized protein LOC122259473 isoform X2 n=1 Tax=Penaeus japonicus TaxID=27405 RepID=UPI001C70FB29|nr:uncharacterized protein LOC122259473 isoform X2 [Penaeus japonicus]
MKSSNFLHSDCFATIGALMNSIMFAILLVMVALFGAGTRKVLEDPAFLEDDDYADVKEEQKQILELVLDHMDAVKLALYILLGISLLCVVTSSMLIHGVRRKRRGLLLPYIVQEVINIIVFIALIIGTFVILGTHKVVVSSMIGVIGGILIHLYFMLVVISQYQALGLIRMHEEISMK